MSSSLYKKVWTNRFFELEVAKSIKRIVSPVYLGIGQEHIAACISEVCPKWAVFPQHRCHSYGLSYGIPPELLMRELLGQNGLNNGMGGSPSFGCSTLKIFGHSGLLGDQGPIACGYAHGSNHNTICILGDAAVEEDYVLGSLGYAATHKLPILFIVEDNNLSILTKKEERRSWNIINVAIGFGLSAYEIDDKPTKILEICNIAKQNLPALINIKTVRHMWHVGAGQDTKPEFDRLDEIPGEGKELIKDEMEKLWT